MCRVTGPDRRAARSSCSCAAGGTTAAPAPDDPALARYFPADVARRPGDGAAPGPDDGPLERAGHRPPPDQRRHRAGTRRRRATEIHIVNPYISNRAILARLLAAAQRGVASGWSHPGKPTPPYPAAAFRHWYGRLMDAGVEILLHPEMAHAKVLRIDDQVLIGGCNLDDLSLFRNDELDLLFDGRRRCRPDRAIRIFDELVAMSTPAVATTGSRRDRVWNATMDRVSRLL